MTVQARASRCFLLTSLQWVVVSPFHFPSHASYHDSAQKPTAKYLCFILLEIFAQKAGYLMPS